MPAPQPLRTPARRSRTKSSGVSPDVLIDQPRVQFLPPTSVDGVQTDIARSYDVSHSTIQPIELTATIAT